LISEQASSTDANARRKQNDSIVNVLNLVMNNNVKEIKVTGVSAIPDSLISVYNNTGIKTGSRFDSERNLTCELAIPLKCLEFLKSNITSLNYQIALNGLNSAETFYFKNARPDGIVSVTNIPRSMSEGANNSISQIVNYSTDFWGVYTLAK
jgi:hypothetical protein